MKQAKIVRVEREEDLWNRKNPYMPYWGRRNRKGEVKWVVTYKIAGNRHHYIDVMAVDELDAYKKGFEQAENKRIVEVRADLDAWEEIRKHMPNAELPEKLIKRKRKEI